MFGFRADLLESAGAEPRSGPASGRQGSGTDRCACSERLGCAPARGVRGCARDLAVETIAWPAAASEGTAADKGQCGNREHRFRHYVKLTFHRLSLRLIVPVRCLHGLGSAPAAVFR